MNIFEGKIMLPPLYTPDIFSLLPFILLSGCCKSNMVLVLFALQFGFCGRGI